MLVSGKKILEKAYKKHCAVPAVNVFDLMSIRAAISAAKEANCPMFISLAEVHMEVLTPTQCAVIVKEFAKDLEQDIALHVDHGFTKSLIEEAIEAGFTSVMIDGSSLSYEDNVRVTKEIVEIAHSKGVTVEAEIGHVGGGESYIDPDKDASMLTTKEDAVNFVKDTNIDYLAVSIGTAHGEYKGTPHLNFERLTEIYEDVKVPLVLHGGSGTGAENINKCTKLGISKVNVFTDLANAARNEVRDGFDLRPYYDSYKLATEGFKNKIIEYFEILDTKDYYND